MKRFVRVHCTSMVDSTPHATFVAPAAYHTGDLRHLRRYLADAQSVSLVGVSNVGKSALLRDLCQNDAAAPPEEREGDLDCYYVDCNRMLDWTELAFYELVLRVLADHLRVEEHPLAPVFSQSHEALLQPAGDLQIPLTFDRALTALVEHTTHPVVLVLDEFDAPFTHLAPRVFLNLRALKDRYPRRLAYVTATDRSLARLRTGEHVDEFTELFGEDAYYLLPLGPEEAQAFIKDQGQHRHIVLDAADVAFVLRQAGGHPGLMTIVCRRLADLGGKPERPSSEAAIVHRQLQDVLRTDASVRTECDKIWRDLDEEEQDELSGLFQPAGVHNPRAFVELTRKGLVTGSQQEPQFFAELFRRFVQQMSAARKLPEQGVRIDVETGEAKIDGRLVETLTSSEYRLLLLLYGHLNKICDKYQIVEAVWGEDYVDEVYDASIDKLISRLRHKIEPDLANPRYLVTVRGRGYKLVG